MQIETNEFRRTGPLHATGGTSESPANTNEQGNQCRRGNNKNRRANRETKFEGKSSELKGSVYDVVIEEDSFTKTTREIAEYVRLLCCYGILLTKCGSTEILFYMIRNSKLLVRCVMLRSMMLILSCMRRLIHTPQRIDGTLMFRWLFNCVSH
jgi:hypothetical protein